MQIGLSEATTAPPCRFPLRSARGLVYDRRKPWGEAWAVSTRSCTRHSSRRPIGGRRGDRASCPSRTSRRTPTSSSSARGYAGLTRRWSLPQRRRRGRHRGRGSRLRRLDAERRRGERRRQYRQELQRKEPVGDESERAAHLLSDAADAFTLIERIIEREKIQCFWEKRGRFVGAWTPKHYAALARRSSGSTAAQSGAHMLPRARQREEIATDYYYGGMASSAPAQLHPALYYEGLLDAARSRGIAICAEAPVERIARDARQLAGRDLARHDRGRRGHDRDQRLYRRRDAALKRSVIPIASHIIATEELPRIWRPRSSRRGQPSPIRARPLLLPACRPTARGSIFGGRAKFTPATPRDERADPPPLHDRPLSAARRRPRHPCLDRQCRLHPRLRCRIWGARTACITRSAATAAAWR